MISVADLCPLPRYPLQRKRATRLSILHLRNDSTLKTLKIEPRASKQHEIEHILAYYSAPNRAHSSNLDIGDGSLVLYLGDDYQVPALSYDLGLPVASGNWIWLWGPDTTFSSSDIREVAATLSRADSNHLIWLQPPGDPTRGKPVTINEIYDGLCPAPDSLIWRADIFERWGCFDPHLVVGDAFAYEMLLRVIRHIRIATLATRDGTPAIYDPKRLNDLVLYAQSRATAPTFDSLARYAIDDLSVVERARGAEIAWRLYLEKILPYYNRHRAQLAPGLFIAPQSVPRERITALFTKAQYETSNELTFGNYARHFKDSRRFAFSYLQSRMLADARLQLDLRRADRVDALVLTRTADDMNSALLNDARAAGCATAYLTDDDLLTFHAYGGAFTAFRPGNPAYDAMTRAIRDADVVIGFSDQIERSTAPLNRRYVHCEDSVPPEFLPAEIAKPARAVTHFGYAGGGYRTEEFALLRPAIQRILDEYGDAVQFSFWGMAPEDVNVRGNVTFVPFSAHYFEYLARLRDAGFDAMLVPLMAEPAPKKAKNPNKFMEAAIANAVGLYSDVPSYHVVKPGITGIKVVETTDAWYAAMKALIEMPEEARAKIRAHARAYVSAFYSTPALAWTNETGILAARLHHKLKAKRLDDGRPLIAYFFPSVAGTGGGEIQLWRRLELARQLGLRALVVISSCWVNEQAAARATQFLDEIGVEHEFVAYNAFFTTPTGLDISPQKPEVAALRDFFSRRGDQIALVHSLAFLPAVGMVCSEFNIPHLASIYGIEDAYEFPDGPFPFKYCDLIQSDSIHYAKKWASLLQCEWVCARENAPAALYEIGFERLYVEPAPRTDRVTLAMVGTFTERKSQLQVIQALSRLPKDILERVEVNLYGGVDVYPAYGAACRAAQAQAESVGARVAFPGHVRDLASIYARTDIVLSVSTLESFPSAIKEASASGCLVIASQAGGIAEMMVDGVNCFLVDQVDPRSLADAITRAVTARAEETLAMRRHAYALAVEEFHPRRTLHDLALCYDLCVKLATPACVPVPVAAPPSPPPAMRAMTDARVVYRVVAQHDGWMGLDVLIGTHQRPARGALNARVYSQDRRLLRAVSLELAAIQDNSWVELRFAPIANTAGRAFIIEFSITNPGAETLIGLSERGSPTPPRWRAFERIARHFRAARARDTLDCQMRYAQ